MTIIAQGIHLPSPRVRDHATRPTCHSMVLSFVLALFGLLDTPEAHAQNRNSAGSLKASQAAAKSADVAAPLRRLDLVSEIAAQSQRSMRLYLQVLLEVDTERSKTREADAVARISKAIDRLRKETLSKAAETLLTESDALWSQMIRPLSGQPAKETLPALLALNDKLTAALDALANTLVREVKSGQGDLIGLVARQGVLAQQIGKQYFVIHAGVRSAEYRQAMLATLRQFSTIQEELDEFGNTNPKYKGDLDLARVQLIFLRNLAERGDSANRQDWISMSRVCERLNEVFAHLVQEIEKGT